jgi:hypothetical protein
MHSFINCSTFRTSNARTNVLVPARFVREPANSQHILLFSERVRLEPQLHFDNTRLFFIQRTLGVVLFFIGRSHKKPRSRLQIGSRGGGIYVMLVKMGIAWHSRSHSHSFRQTHAQSYTHMHTLFHFHSLLHSLTLSHSRTLALSHSRTLALSHSLTLSLSHSLTLSLSHSLTLSLAATHSF